jgi:hypothetical protein
MLPRFIRKHGFSLAEGCLLLAGFAARVLTRCLREDSLTSGGNLLMPTARITKPAVDAISAGARDVFLWDDELRGFGVRITPSRSDGGKLLTWPSPAMSKPS